jgi:hypothetical protein
VCEIGPLIHSSFASCPGTARQARWALPRRILIRRRIDRGAMLPEGVAHSVSHPQGSDPRFRTCARWGLQPPPRTFRACGSLMAWRQRRTVLDGARARSGMGPFRLLQLHAVQVFVRNGGLYFSQRLCQKANHASLARIADTQPDDLRERFSSSSSFIVRGARRHGARDQQRTPSMPGCRPFPTPGSLQ